MHSYCIHCGSKSVYESTPNKFCGSCGNPFNRAIQKQESNSSSSKSKRKSIFVNNDDEDDDEDEFEDFQIDKRELANSVEGVVTASRFPTFEELAIQNAAPRGERYVRPEFKVDGDIIKATLRECGKVQVSKEVGDN